MLWYQTLREKILFLPTPLLFPPSSHSLRDLFPRSLLGTVSDLPPSSFMTQLELLPWVLCTYKHPNDACKKKEGVLLLLLHAEEGGREKGLSCKRWTTCRGALLLPLRHHHKWKFCFPFRKKSLSSKSHIRKWHMSERNWYKQKESHSVCETSHPRGRKSNVQYYHALHPTAASISSLSLSLSLSSSSCHDCQHTTFFPFPQRP